MLDERMAVECPAAFGVAARQDGSPRAAVTSPKSRPLSRFMSPKPYIHLLAANLALDSVYRHENSTKHAFLRKRHAYSGWRNTGFRALENAHTTEWDLFSRSNLYIDTSSNRKAKSVLLLP